MSTTNGPTTSQIPVIDISGSIPEARVAKELIDAAATYGFVYIRNLGKDIPVEAINKAFELSRKFFASPIEEKEKCKIKEDNMGWSGMHTETLDVKNQRIGDFKEAFNFGEFDNGKARQPLPEALRDHEADINSFQDYCHNLCLKILTLFGIGLDIDSEAGGATWFASRHDRAVGPSGCTLRMLYYPSVPAGSDYQPDVDIRAGAHSDYGSITLLFQRPGQPGLEILPPNTKPSDKNYDGTKDWTPVPVSPQSTIDDPSPPILVNIGDLLDYWTRNLFKSTVHRVVFPREGKEGGEDRYSIAFFCHPVGATMLEPVPSEMIRLRPEVIGGDETLGKKVMTANEHLLSRLKATYLGLYKDEEQVQVA